MSAFSELGARLHSLLFRKHEEREMDEELRFHVDMEAERLRQAGAGTVDARRRGVLALGGIERTKEEVRDARGTALLEELARDASFAVRTLARSPAFTAIVILTLAIGIGATTAIFSAVDTVLLAPLPYQQPGQLVRLYQYFGTHNQDRGVVTPVHYLAYREQVSSFDGVATAITYSTVGMDLSRGDQPERIRVLPVSADYADVLRARPALGRWFDRDEETGAHAIVLSHALWTRLFRGDPSVVGKPLTMDGMPYTVVGVMAARFTDPLVDGVDAWVPVDLRPGLDASNADNHYLDVIGRLRPGISLRQAQADLDAVGVRLAHEYSDAHEIRARLYPLRDAVVGSSARPLEMILGAVGLVLLLVCVNVATLLLVRGSKRAHELALRAALGARRSHLVRQTLVETLMLALAGGAAGLVVARLCVAAIVALGSSSVPRLSHLALQPLVFAFALAVSCLCAILFGFVPAVRAARTQPIDAIRQEGRGGTGGTQSRLRTGLVVAQVALAFVLVAGAGILLLSFARLRDVPLGMTTRNALVFELHLPEARYDSTARARFYEEVSTALEHIPGVRAAGGISKLPVTGSYNSWGTVALTGPEAGIRSAVRSHEQRVVSGAYFAAAGIPVLEGRVFDARDALGTPCRVVASASLATTLFPGTDPIGQQLAAADTTRCTIIGVVGDVALDAEGTVDGTVYHAHAQFAGNRNWALTQVVSTTRPPETLIPSIRRVLAAMDPQLVVYRPMTLNDAIGAGTAQRRFTLTILGAFALVALGLAALGLFGVLSYGVELRAREFGVRLALGAEPGAIRRLVLRHGLSVTITGIAAGVAGAAVLSRVMTSLVFHVATLDPAVLSVAAVFIVGVGAAAAYLPARRATAVDPRDILQ